MKIQHYSALALVTFLLVSFPVTAEEMNEAGRSGPGTAELKIISQTSGPWNTNCFLLYDTVRKEAAIVDPGRPIDTLLAHISEQGLELKYIFITHCHQDHIAGVAELREQFPDAKLCFTKDEYDARILYGNWKELFARESVEAWQKDADIVTLMNLDYGSIGKPDIFVDEEQEFKLGRLTVRALKTPGHSKGSASYFVGNAIFSGDLIFFNTVGYLEYQLGSKEDAVQSVRRLYEMFSDDTVIYPGHGPVSDIGHEKQSNTNVTADSISW